MREKEAIVNFNQGKSWILFSINFIWVKNGIIIFLDQKLQLWFSQEIPWIKKYIFLR